MKSINAILTGLGAGLVLGLLSFTPAAQAADNAAQAMPSYTPPMLGSPTRRIGGGARGMARGMARSMESVDAGKFFIAAVVPETTAYSSSAQPTLYWAVSEPVTVGLEFVIHNPQAAVANRMPLVEQKLPNAAVGIHPINLADYQAKLEPGVEYEWSVSVIPDPASPSLNIITSGTIKYMEAAAGDLLEQTKGMAPAEIVKLYAAQGYWYDAIHLVSKQIAAEPANPQWLEMRKTLLEQVGLSNVAALAL